MNTAINLNEYPVSDEHVAFFQENGYVRLEGVLARSEVETMQDALASAIEKRQGFVRDLAVEEGADPAVAKEDKILQLLNVWEHSAVIRSYSMSPRLARIARRLTGSSSIFLFHDQPPHRSAWGNTHAERCGG